MIPLANPKAQLDSSAEGIREAIERVLQGGWYILGPEVQAFEAEFASYCGVAHGVGVGSGTEALVVALRACDVGPGDEVITVSHTASATASAILQTGARPVFVDIEPDRFTMDPAGVQAAITPRTRAVVPVHLYGQPADMPAILDIARAHGLRVIEDCAQAHGALHGESRVGSMGDIGCFSFYPTKNLGALGDGGMLVTSDPQLARRARLLREYGWKTRFDSSLPGWNSRLDELQAAVLRVKLRTLDADNERRRALAALYHDLLADSGLVLPVERPGTSHVYHLYVVRSDDRDGLKAHLAAHDIGSGIHYPVPAHRQAAFGHDGTDLPRTDAAVRSILSLPMFPELGEEDVARVASRVLEAG